jgi:hypothetical protein
MLPDPSTLRLFNAGVAVPESVTKLVGTVASADIVGSPATPAPLDIEIPVPGWNVLNAHVSLPVRAENPVPVNASNAARSFAGDRVNVAPEPKVVMPVVPMTDITPPLSVAAPELPCSVLSEPPPPPPVLVIMIDPGPLVIEMPAPAVNVPMFK